MSSLDTRSRSAIPLQKFVRFLVTVGALALAPLSGARAQDFVEYFCLFGYNEWDKIAWVGRSVVRTQAINSPNRPYLINSRMERDFLARMRGAYSSEDLNLPDRSSYDYTGAYAAGFPTAGEAQRTCLESVAEYRSRGFDVHGLGEPLFNGGDDVIVRHLGFLSAVEFPNYIPGTVAERERRRRAGLAAEAGGSPGGTTPGSGGGTPTRPGPRWVNGRCIGAWYECETREQVRERLRLTKEREIAFTRRLVQEADAQFERRDYRAARETYARATRMYRHAEVREEQLRAQEQVEYIDRNLATLEYVAFSVATGIAFGVALGQSALAGDNNSLYSGLMQLKTFGVPVVYSWGTGRTVLGNFFGENSTAGLAGEFTRYTLGANMTIPQTRIGNWALHVGYQFQKTTRRELNLLTSGISWGGDGNLLFRFDVTPVYGKMMYGGALVFDVGRFFE